MHSWIRTYTGKRFDPFAPDLSAIDIEDIAHALSNLCRFTGHTNSFYSVAQHSVYVSGKVPERDALWGLLHDASEAYLNDISRPIKVQACMTGYATLESLVISAIATKFGLTCPAPPSIKIADRRMLLTECRDLLAPMEWDIDSKKAWDVEDHPYKFNIAPWTPHVAKMQFLTRYEQCQRALSASI